jgi:hypothetical protein
MLIFGCGWTDQFLKRVIPSMSDKESKFNKICEKLSQISGSEWIAIKFDKQISANNIEPVRFCEAVYMAQKKPISLSLSKLCCDGAKRCFGWLKDGDMKLSQRLSEKNRHQSGHSL